MSRKYMCRYANSRVEACTVSDQAQTSADEIEGNREKYGVASSALNYVPAIDEADNSRQKMAKNELDLLAKLIGGECMRKDEGDTFRLSIFDRETEARYYYRCTTFTYTASVTHAVNMTRNTKNFPARWLWRV